MSDVNALLSTRMKKNSKSTKMAQMGKDSASGNLTSFSGLFGVIELSHNEKDFLEAILHEYASGEENFSADLRSLIAITSEVKAINNQAAMLHGERIKKAQSVLTRYRDGAFTTWLIAAYGNRQTPYNFLQYYEFHQAMPKDLRPQIELMPRQAVYTLASREGSMEKKKKIVQNYDGETKGEMLAIIRDTFPLATKDKRSQNFGDTTILGLNRLCLTLQKQGRLTITKKQKETIFDLINELIDLVEQSKSR